MPRYPMPRPVERIAAGRLTAEHIGKRVQFSYTLEPSKVRAIVFGDLREVHHDGEGSTLWLSGSDSAGDKTMFEMPSVKPVGVREAAQWKEL
ncbi:hypothetical protein SEA_JEEVES_73 [Mycobacterium phage Jeeves]|uniref:Uncharacterized protein n=1 Tax=Mycobacterium phage Jeeves TaxID=2652402 RepID=A0A5J6T2Z3_9CAUD|nr:hypothetical protein KNU75_gp036 [Mycobacterium phage Jeeves]QFG04548.1 hypothetical protein SEA_JEEVES_73 [Mycobacterium phage Jeeves]